MAEQTDPNDDEEEVEEEIDEEPELDISDGSGDVMGNVSQGRGGGMCTTCALMVSWFTGLDQLYHIWINGIRT